MPDGSYFSHSTPGMMGKSTKLTAIDSATNSAYMAMRLVDQRPESATPVECALSGRVMLSLAISAVLFWVLFGEDTLMLSPVSSIRTLTVGPGFSPDQPLSRVAGFGMGPL